MNYAVTLNKFKWNEISQKNHDILCQGKLRPYELNHAGKVNLPIALMCQVLKLTKSGYYAWCDRKLFPRTRENEILSQEIQPIHQDSREAYGSPWIHAALVAKGL